MPDKTKGCAWLKNARLWRARKGENSYKDSALGLINGGPPLWANNTEVGLRLSKNC